MRKFWDRIALGLGVGLALGAMVFAPSCANTTTPPSGGPKDTIPPVIVKVQPLSGATNVPRKGTKLKLTFNEYVVIKENKNIYLSPPPEKKPNAKIREKSLIVSFEGLLDSAKTYVLDLTGAIVDNNEGNPRQPDTCARGRSDGNALQRSLRFGDFQKASRCGVQNGCMGLFLPAEHSGYALSDVCHPGQRRQQCL